MTKVPFGSLLTGAYFQYQGDLWYKIILTNGNNAYNITKGTYHFIGANTEVEV